jgi:hypothetical protein
MALGIALLRTALGAERLGTGDRLERAGCRALFGAGSCGRGASPFNRKLALALRDCPSSGRGGADRDAGIALRKSGWTPARCAWGFVICRRRSVFGTRSGSSSPDANRRSSSRHYRHLLRHLALHSRTAEGSADPAARPPGASFIPRLGNGIGVLLHCPIGWTARPALLPATVARPQRGGPPDWFDFVATRRRKHQPCRKPTGKSVSRQEHSVPRARCCWPLAWPVLPCGLWTDRLRRSRRVL